MRNTDPQAIFERRKLQKSGQEVVTKPTFLQKVLYKIISLMGVSLFSVSFLFLLFSLGPVFREQIRYETKNITADGGIDSASVQETEAIEKDSLVEEAKGYGVETDFSIVIPKIEAYSNVVANVSVSDKRSYESALKEGVAHARGTYFPGQDRRIYLFSHSVSSSIDFSRYNAIFYLIGKLEKGDLIIIYFADEKYEYEVFEKHVVSASDVSWLDADTSSEELVLQTCDPPGTSWKRLLVVAKPVRK